MLQRLLNPGFSAGCLRLHKTLTKFSPLNDKKNSRVTSCFADGKCLDCETFCKRQYGAIPLPEVDQRSDGDSCGAPSKSEIKDFKFEVDFDVEAIQLRDFNYHLSGLLNVAFNQYTEFPFPAKLLMFSLLG